MVKCSDCQFVWTIDPPAIEDIGPYYKSDVYISHSDSKRGLINKLYHRVRDYMLKRKHKVITQWAPQGQVLDYGCGTGYFVKYLNDKGLKVTGMEIDADARDYAAKQFGLEILDPQRLYDRSLDHQFKAITMWHVLEHIYDLRHFVSRLSECLDHDGALFVAVPNRDSKDAQKYGTDWAAYDVPRHLWHFRPKDIKALFGHVGMEVVHQEHMPFDPFYNAMLSEQYRKSTLAPVKGGLSGLNALAAGISQMDKASSIIYVIKKKKPV